MQTGTRGKGITFRVHQVTQSDEQLPTCKTRDSVSLLLACINERQPEPIISCSGYNSNCVSHVGYHPLLSATHMAFSRHLPLVLSPDMIWVTIVQGLSQHVRNHAEQLRSKLVRHQGKMEIQIERDDLLEGSPENAWDEVVHQLSEAVRGQLLTRYDELVSDFSTTGDIERTACEIALLDTFSPYFEYYVRCVCGIPTITLEGQPSDWKKLRDKVESLLEYDLELWVKDLRIILDQFERASRGDVDLKFWENIYKQKQAYGADVINGWIVKLIPYLKCGQSGNYSIVNPAIGGPFEIAAEQPKKEGGFSYMDFAGPNDVTSSVLPGGVSVVNFELTCQSGSKKRLQFLGGFLGVEQLENNAVRPKLGWAVRNAQQSDALLADLPADCKMESPLDPSEYADQLARLSADGFRVHVPGDFISFYKQCDGLQFEGNGVGRFRSLKSIELIPSPQLEADSILPYRAMELQRISEPDQDHDWFKFCDLPNDSYVVLEPVGIKEQEFDFPGENGSVERWNAVMEYEALPSVNRIVLVNGSTGKGRVIARSFAEFVRMFVDSGGRFSN